jgi:hypothetical protein
VRRFLGRDDEGREILSWIEGDVALPPYPSWSLADQLLDSVARLLRELHDATEDFEAGRWSWASELADPAGGPVMCHADVRLENLVRDRTGRFAMIDLDLVAPGRRVWDVVSAARHLVPLRTPDLLTREQGDLDTHTRLRRFVDAYGLDDDDRHDFATVMAQRAAVGHGFVLGRLAHGEGAFAARWAGQAGRARMDADARWIDESRDRITTALIG